MFWQLWRDKGGWMPRVSERDYRRMKNSYDHTIAKALVEVARAGITITYGELGKRYGRTSRGWGDVLGGIAIRCRERGVPMLSVLVVNASTGLPSTDAILYEDLGLATPDDVSAEQQRCFAFDWSNTPIGR